MSMVPTQPPREMTHLEKAWAKYVFGSSINYTLVRITDAYGFGNTFWVSPPVPVFFPYFGVHMGPSYFANPIPDSPGFIHELTHVWQGQRGIPYEYVLNSGAHQGWSVVTTGSPSQAYAYGDQSDQRQWNQYNVEQQARIVQDWFRFGSDYGNRSKYDWRYRYIISNIRNGNPNANSVPVQPQSIWDGPSLAEGMSFDPTKMKNFHKNR